MRQGWASTGSALRHISWRRWRSGRAAACSRSRARGMTRRSGSRVRWARMGRGIGRKPARGARRRDHLRAGRLACAARAEGRAQGRAGRLRRHSHERHSDRLRTRCCGTSASWCRSPISRARMASSFSRSPRRRGVTTHVTTYDLRARTTRWTICAVDGFRARRCSFPEHGSAHGRCARRAARSAGSSRRRTRRTARILRRAGVVRRRCRDAPA